mgnify:CR=1 FL=1
MNAGPSATMTTPANTTSPNEIHLRKPDFQSAAPAPKGAPDEVAIRADKFDGWYGEFHALKGISLLARTASLIAHLQEETERPIGFIMSGAAAERIGFEPLD